LALNPIFAPETHGYDVVDYLRIDPRLGDDGDVEWLVDACHRRAIRVLFDGVFTHVGRSFPASGRVYAVLASKETVTGPLTIQYRTATGGVGEAQVAWVVEPLRGTRRIRVTREEIRLRLTASPLTVVVSADHIEVESAPQRFPTGQRLAEFAPSWSSTSSPCQRTLVDHEIGQAVRNGVGIVPRFPGRSGCTGGYRLKMFARPT
jgi:hypothetical protein